MGFTVSAPAARKPCCCLFRTLQDLHRQQHGLRMLHASPNYKWSLTIACPLPLRDHVIRYQGISALLFPELGDFRIEACLRLSTASVR